MLNVLLVGAGGFLGSALRYLIGGVAQSFAGSPAFPYGTLVVNALGCFAIGFVSELAESHGAFSSETRLFLVTGILGGFTTFSAFGNETMNLLRDGEMLLGGINIGLQLVLGLLAVWGGYTVAYLLWR
ncbi:putative fluoride ion transporter CrcB [Nitrospira sp.]|nr:putative fluoride ion transporter CrcB [Nitrospira sp.]